MSRNFDSSIELFFWHRRYVAGTKLSGGDLLAPFMFIACMSHSSTTSYSISFTNKRLYMIELTIERLRDWILRTNLFLGRTNTLCNTNWTDLSVCSPLMFRIFNASSSFFLFSWQKYSLHHLPFGYVKVWIGFTNITIWFINWVKRLHMHLLETILFMLI